VIPFYSLKINKTFNLFNIFSYVLYRKQKLTVPHICEVCPGLNGTMGKEIWPNDIGNHYKSSKHINRAEIEEHREDLQAYWIGTSLNFTYLLVFLYYLYLK
jgi:hypothetical protein